MKKAFIVGINYVGSTAELRGCINDAHNMGTILKTRYGFDEIHFCLEKDATTANILKGLRWLVKGAVPGDVLVFHYSGHGSQVRSNSEPDKLDEIICPIDINWKDRVIKDDQLKEIFDPVPNGVNVTLILDCCHSGTGLDQDDTLFGEEMGAVSDLGLSRVLLQLPVEEGASRYLPPPAEVLEEIEAEGLELREWRTSRDVNRSALLIAGCLPHQTSADAFIAGQHQGAATFSLLQALGQGKTTYKEIAEHMSNFMEVNRFTQRPQLDGHPSLYYQEFAEPFGFNGGLTAAPPPGTWKNPPDAPTTDEQPTTGWRKWMALGIIIAIVAFAVVLSAK